MICRHHLVRESQSVHQLDASDRLALCFNPRVAIHARYDCHRCLATASQHLGRQAGYLPALKLVPVQQDHVPETLGSFAGDHHTVRLQCP
jgi:hypothetical protein